MKIEASKRTHVSAQKALTAAVETAIIIPEISEGDSRVRCPGVCASRLYFLLHFHNRSFESVRGCHAPVLGRQGTAEMRRRAPTYRERWVKNDDSGTLGFYFFKIKTQFNRELRFRFIQKRNVKLTNQYFKNNTKDLCPKVSKGRPESPLVGRWGKAPYSKIPR